MLNFEKFDAGIMPHEKEPERFARVVQGFLENLYSLD